MRNECVDNGTMTSSVRDLPVAERPRERLLRNGSTALSDSELLAVLLRTGRPGQTVLDLSRHVLIECGGLSGLIGVSAHGLRRLGLGAVRTAMVLAALELGRRLARTRLPERRLMSRPAEVASYLSLRFVLPDQEVMGALFLDCRNRLMGEKEIYRGTLSRAAVEPRSVFKEGLLRGAAGFVLFHTHPSGDPSPSVEDLAFTRRMAQSGELLGVRLVDHLIVATGDRWVSLRQRGGW